VRSRPEEVGLGLDGSPEPGAAPPAASAAPADSMWRTSRRFLSDRNFWLISLAIGIVYSNNIALITHLVPYALDAGIARERAADGVSALALFSLLGKLVYSAIGDRFDERAALWLAAVAQAAGWLLLLVAPGYGLMLAIAAAAGLGSGAVLPAWSSLVGRCFGRAQFGSAMGLMALVTRPLMNAGPLLAGYVYAAEQSYATAFQVLAGLSVLMGLLPLGMRLPAVEPLPGALAGAAPGAAAAAVAPALAPASKGGPTAP
jgi:cyanate permease